MAEERVSFRLTLEKKQALETIARDKSMTMTELMKEWILKGDVVTIFTLQLSDFINDFY
jgi:predicted DNA-binding protein